VDTILKIHDPGIPYEPFRLAPCQPTRAVATASADQWDRLRQTVAALYAGHGGGIDGLCLELARSPALSRAAVATASGGVSKP